jgi:spermidine synthase
MRQRHYLALLSIWALCLCGAAAAGERLLLEKKSPYNTILVSEDDKGLRILRFEPGGARQTVVKPGDPDHLELPYVRAIPVAFIYVEKPQRVLVVGLGGGTIPSFLRRRFPDLAIDAVELDPGVVEVAKSHMDFREDANLRAHVEDGRRFIERAAHRYDIIFLDAYGADSVPYRLATREFLQSVRRALTPRGVVVSNIWSRVYNPLYDSMLRTYRGVFDEVSVLDVVIAGNQLVLATPWKPSMSRSEAVRRAAAITKSLPLRYDLAPIVERGLRRAGSDGEAGRILVDADSSDRAPSAAIR